MLHVGGAESVLLVRVNGRDVGFGKDSHLASEFDVTGHVRPGENEVELTVVKWSDATFVEDQDHWWHGGLSRSVYVYTTAATYLADIHAVADFDPSAGEGSLALEVRVGSGGGLAPGWTVRARLGGLGEVRTAQATPSGATPSMPQANRSGYPDEPPASVIPDGMLDLLSLGAAGAPLPPREQEIARRMHAHSLVSRVGHLRIDKAGLTVRPWELDLAAGA
ncbi:hypothetical protein LO772_26830 [Yinghuangia sp. ASG 101]|nr:sugar-binding domain-containing protein [Yinghuangia sp. ASG 101]UGQ10437.1 hypothetical protein LO772_26830 [Yinghuangia sp. ASG 101]